MDDHKLALEKKGQEKSNELKKTNAQLEKMTAHVEEMKESLSNQELSVDDVHNMESEKKGLKEAVDRTVYVNNQHRSSLRVQEEDHDKINLDLDSIISNYNEKLTELIDLAEMSDELGDMKDYFSKEQLCRHEQRETFDVDTQSQVRRTIVLCQDEYVEKYFLVKEELHDELDKVERCEENLNVEKAKHGIVLDKKIKHEQTLESERDSMNVTLSIRQREVDSTESKINSLRDPVALEEQMAAYEGQCSELERLRIDHQEENLAKKKAVVAEIYSACQAMNELDEKFTYAVARAKIYLGIKRADIGIISIPQALEL